MASIRTTRIIIGVGVGAVLLAIIVVLAVTFAPIPSPPIEPLPTPTVTVPQDVPTSVSLWPEPNSQAAVEPHFDFPNIRSHQYRKKKVPKHLLREHIRVFH